MADPTPESLLQAINRLVEAQTFGVQAAEGIAKLREENAALRQKVDALTGQRDAYMNARDAAQKEIETHKAQIKSLEARIAQFVAREDAMVVNEKKTAVAEGKVEILREFTGLVFRNTQVREHIHGNVPFTGSSANPNNYIPTTVPVDRKRDVTEE